MASTNEIGVQTDATIASILSQHLAPNRHSLGSVPSKKVFDLYDHDNDNEDAHGGEMTDVNTLSNEEETTNTSSVPISPSNTNDLSIATSRPMGIGDRITFAEESFHSPSSGRTGSSGQEMVLNDDLVEDDEEEEDKGLAGQITWWFAGKGIPLIAATMGPLANLTSVCAIISSWRVIAPTNGIYIDQQGVPDPHWEIAVNIASLVCGFLGNFLLMLNYAQAISYKIAMPFTILFWYLASGCLASVLIAMHVYAPPHRPEETYSQGYWYGVISACLYLIAASLLFINILGYLRGHYPAHVESSKHERSLMLQTILFFIWLGGGGWVFSRIEGWSFADAIYFCNVTLLTVGFGDLYATTDTGRGIVFPFSVVGIVMLGLVVNSIYGLIVELGQTDVVKSRVEKKRQNTFERAATFSIDDNSDSDPPIHRLKRSNSMKVLAGAVTQVTHRIIRRRAPTAQMILLRASRDRFDAMRYIQESTLRFKRYTALCSSTAAFFLLWLLGAIVFMVAEKETQDLSYFEALYFCYVSLLTIGYGDLSPKSNAGKSFFLIWSLLSVPSITILISSMGNTVIKTFQDATLKVAEYTILPKAGLVTGFKKLYRRWKFGTQKEHELTENDLAEAKRRYEEIHGVEEEEQQQHPSHLHKFNTRDRHSFSKDKVNEDHSITPKTLPKDYTFNQILMELTLAIRRVGFHLQQNPSRKYTYEEWVEITRLIRACEEVKPRKVRGVNRNEWDERVDDDEGFVLWDWIGQDSPLLNEGSEPEWVMDRLTRGLENITRFNHRRRGSDSRTIREWKASLPGSGS